MAASKNKRELELEQRKINNRKDKLLGLTAQTGTSIAAFDRVRLLHDQEHKTWLEAYDLVISELEAGQ